MAQYISKSALVAEIERRKNICQGVAEANENNEFAHLYYNGKTEAYSEMSEFLDTLEVKEVDFVQEYDKEYTNDPVYSKLVNRNAGLGIAKHFFELGLKAKVE